MGDSADDAHHAYSSGDPAPIEVELVEEDIIPDAPNTAASGTETIRGGSTTWARLVRLPRALRVVGALAAVAALSIALWPNGARTQSGAHSGTPSAPATSTAQQSEVSGDIYKVRVASTELTQDFRDHAVMDLELANDAHTALSVVNAEVWDSVQTRIGFSSNWPAGDLAPAQATSVPIELPYSCGVLQPTPVLPVTIRYSVSTSQDPTISHNYEYPLSQVVWDEFMRARAGLCTGPAGGVFATSVDLAPTTGGYRDSDSVDLTLTMDAVGRPGWNLEALTSSIPGATVTTASLPAALSAGQSVAVLTHWRFTACFDPPDWSSGFSAVEVRIRPAPRPRTAPGTSS
ncbi:hypothetical protein ACFQ9X_16195 [Catenulispora yoronensis]